MREIKKSSTYHKSFNQSKANWLPFSERSIDSHQSQIEQQQQKLIKEFKLTSLAASLILNNWAVARRKVEEEREWCSQIIDDRSMVHIHMHTRSGKREAGRT